MNIKKGLRRIGLLCGIVAGVLCITILLVRTWRGTSYKVPREPTTEEIVLAKSSAFLEPRFIWFRMLELDPRETLIPDRRYVDEPDQWGLLAKEEYRPDVYYLYDEYILQYIKSSPGRLHGPDDLDGSFVNGIYLAHTIGVDPNYARTHQDELFRQEAAKNTFKEQKQMPWKVEDLLTTSVISVAVFLGLWLLPYTAYFSLKKLIGYIRNGFA
jgi:hypothetical protein